MLYLQNCSWFFDKIYSIAEECSGICDVKITANAQYEYMRVDEHVWGAMLEHRQKQTPKPINIAKL